MGVSWTQTPTNQQRREGRRQVGGKNSRRLAAVVVSPFRAARRAERALISARARVPRLRLFPWFSAEPGFKA
jgi:hypothetical protein